MIDFLLSVPGKLKTISDYLTTNWTTGRAAKIDFLDATISTRATSTQVTSAVAAGVVTKYQEFTASGTFTPSAALLARGGFVRLDLRGGGGGGGSGFYGGGGGGGSSKLIKCVTVSGAVTVTLGVGGAGTAAAAGADGTNSTFGALATATGGGGGGGGNAVANYYQGYFGGAAGSQGFVGAQGQNAIVDGASLFAVSQGASGGGEGGGKGGNYVGGAAAANTGGGGGGGGNGSAGGSGGSGYCCVEWEE